MTLSHSSVRSGSETAENLNVSAALDLCEASLIKKAPIRGPRPSSFTFHHIDRHCTDPCKYTTI